MPYPALRDFINKELEASILKDKTKILFNQCIKYMAILSRKILSERVRCYRNKFEITTVSAALDEGMWRSINGNQRKEDSSLVGMTPTFAERPEQLSSGFFFDPILEKHHLI